jgi:hypothetical protein
MIELLFLLIGLFIGWNTVEPQIAKTIRYHLLNFIKEKTENTHGPNKN